MSAERATPICDKNCFECPYPDCIYDDMDAEDWRDAEALDKFIANPVHSERREKRAAAWRRWYEANQEYRLAQQKDYRLANQETIRQKHAAYYEQHKAAISAKYREWYAANKDRRRAYYEANKEHIAALHRAWYLENKEAISAKRREQYRIKKDPVLRKKATQAARDAAYYRKNRGQIRARQKAYHEANKERDNARCRQWYAANREAVAAQVKKRYEIDRDFILARQKRYEERYQQESAADGAELRAWRLQHDLTQRELGESLGVSNATVSYWESGKRHVPERVLAMIRGTETNNQKGGNTHERDHQHTVD